MNDSVEPIDTNLPTFLSQRTLPFPVASVPLHDPFPGANFYVRACYAEYYELIFQRYESKFTLGVSIAGTPGIGKSVFMAYFFLRYTLEHPEKTVVLVSINSRSELQRVVVWKNNHTTERWALNLRFLSLQFTGDPEAIFLLDGTPNMAPMMGHQYVVFTTCLSTSWLLDMVSESNHMALYLPLWDAEELLDAVDALQLHSALGRLDQLPSVSQCCLTSQHDHEVLHRFAVFGGVARVCLSSNLAVVAAYWKKLQCAVDTVDIVTGQVTRNRVDCMGLYTSLYHSIPRDDSFLERVKLASPYVAQLLYQRVLDLNENDRERVTRMIGVSRETTALYTAVYAQLAHKQLHTGVHLVARPLVAKGDHVPHALNLQIPPSVGSVMRLVGKTFDRSVLANPLNRYFEPESKAYESIDAFYLIKNGDLRAAAPWSDVDIVLFQVAVTTNHPVPPKALYAMLKQLDVRDPQRVALVFVVPQRLVAAGFPRQFVDATVTFNDSSPITVVSGPSMGSIAGALAGANITTIGHLRQRSLSDATDQLDGDATPRDDAFAKAQDLLRHYENEAVAWHSDSHTFLEQIPQFVWSLEAAPITLI